MIGTVLILGGSGKIGKHSAAAFWNAGWTVRHYDRSSGDMTTAALGADVIVNGLNPPKYHNWAVTIPAITSQVIAAAKVSGATVIVPGNVYNFGDQGGVWDENTPHRPNSRKGQIRVAMEQAYAAAGVQTIILRAGDFIDPDQNGDGYSLVTMAKLRRGKITALGDIDAIHAYAYVPDWARAAEQLAQIRGTLATFEDIPFPGHAFTIRQLRDLVAERSGRDIGIGRFPWWIMRTLSPFWELARELIEMRYLTSVPHQLGHEKFNRLLSDFQPTERETVMLTGLEQQIDPDEAVRPRGKPLPAE